MGGRVAFIFHCEFSAHRGPRVCKFFRKLDREYNQYPSLVFIHHLFIYFIYSNIFLSCPVELLRLMLISLLL